MRRKRNTTVRDLRSRVWFRDEPCTTCGTVYRWFDLQAGASRTCEHCAAVAGGAVPRGTMPDGSAPRLHLYQGNVEQACTSCGTRVVLTDLQPDGRCTFCTLPGSVQVRDGHAVLKVDGRLAFVPDHRGGVAYAFALQPDGRAQVQVVDQSRGARGFEYVDVTTNPKWGQGWLVRCLDGEQRYWRDDWDTSD